MTKLTNTNFAKRDHFLPFAKPDMGEAEVKAVAAVIRSGWLTTGPVTKQFEAAFAAYMSMPHAIATNSGTAALHLALEAVGVSAGDEVITSVYTFTATAAVIEHLGATPVLCDVEPRSLNMDTRQLEQYITPRTKAIVPVHMAGQPADMDEICTLAKQHGVAVIEDAAHALPATYKGKRVGTIGDFTAFSFYATKTLATGEGGMLTTRHDDWAERCRVMALHGISKDAWKRYTNEGSWYYEVIAPGYKYNMGDMQAAIGMVQLDKLDAMTQRRQAIARRYDAAFGNVAARQIPQVLPDRSHCYHLYPLRLNTDALQLDRDAFIKALKELNIGTSVHFIPLHLHPHYSQTYGLRPQDFPVAYAQYQRLVSLPIYSAMSDADVESVMAAVCHLAQVYEA